MKTTGTAVQTARRITRKISMRKNPHAKSRKRKTKKFWIRPESLVRLRPAIQTKEAAADEDWEMMTKRRTLMMPWK